MILFNSFNKTTPVSKISKSPSVLFSITLIRDKSQELVFEENSRKFFCRIIPDKQCLSKSCFERGYIYRHSIIRSVAFHIKHNLFRKIWVFSLNLLQNTFSNSTNTNA